MKLIQMNALFQKALCIREDGTCSVHPDVTVYRKNGSMVETCQLCSSESQLKDGPNHDTCTTAASSSFWSNAGCDSDDAPSPASSGSGQYSGEEKTERRQQQQLIDSVLARWSQLQDLGLQNSIALSITPLVLAELQKFEAKAREQESIICKHEATIKEMQRTMAQQHQATQEVLQGILESMQNNNGRQNQQNTKQSTDIQLDNAPSQRNDIAYIPVPTEHKRRSTLDSEIKQPLTTHSSTHDIMIPTEQEESARNLSIAKVGVDPSRGDLKPMAKKSGSRREKPVATGQQQDMIDQSFRVGDLWGDTDSDFKDPRLSTLHLKMSASQPISFHHGAKTEQERLHASQPLVWDHREIVLEESCSALNCSRTDLPDINEIFEEGAGQDLDSVKKKKFGGSIVARRRGSKQMDIVLEAAVDRNQANSSDVVPKIPVFNSFGKTTGKQVPPPPPPRREISLGELSRGHISCVTMDTAFPRDEEVSELGVGSRRWPFEDQDSMSHMRFEDLESVARYPLTDMYGDRGLYTGTLGPSKEPEGFGTMKYNSGRFFKGEWRDGRWHGKGTLLNANGDSYQGEFASDARHGKGIYRFTSGDVYEGDFFEDNRHGKGTFKFHNGSVYTGDFQYGSFEGQGKYTFDGGYYIGSWKRDEYDGQGKLQYNDSSSYIGNFKRGSAHGYGEETTRAGIRKGLWRHGDFIRVCTSDECISEKDQK